MMTGDLIQEEQCLILNQFSIKKKNRMILNPENMMLWVLAKILMVLSWPINLFYFCCEVCLL